MSLQIKLVLQSAETGERKDVPGTWTPKSTLSEIMDTMGVHLPVCTWLENNAAIRYLQTVVPQSLWFKTTLKSMGLSQGGRALLILTKSSTNAGTNAIGSASQTDNQNVHMTDSQQDPLEASLQILFNSNFDSDTKACIIVLIKVLDNVLQKPQEPKVRSIRLANPAFAKKVVERKGGVDFLIACGFRSQQDSPNLLSRVDTGEQCLVLTAANENTNHLVKARRLLTKKAIDDLQMRADELPKYKPPVRLTDARDHQDARSQMTTSGQEFNPYKEHRFDGMSAALGESFGPDSNYVSPTEQQLQALQSQQKKLENSLHKPLLDRELSASLPAAMPSNVSAVASSAMMSEAPSDGSLLASQFSKREKERRQREEKGFTTKAMRDLQLLKKQKVYSHAQLRIQFSDGSALEAKFLPKEKIEAVKSVVKSALLIPDLDFDLYVAPPRRKLMDSSSLQAEGLVPAAKVFLSWKTDSAPPRGALVGTFLKPELFRNGNAPAYPSAKALTQEQEELRAAKKSKPGVNVSKSSKEDDLVRRMMGQGGGLGKPRGGGTPGGGKPKWFKK